MYVNRFSLAALVLLIIGTAMAAPPEKELLGKWETKDPDSQQTITLDFADKGTFKVGVGPVMLEGKYKFADDETLEMTMTIMDTMQTEKVKVKVGNGELVITGKDNKPMKFTKAK
jgi:uncharacterized protein (TIGR03066 family)